MNALLKPSEFPVQFGACLGVSGGCGIQIGEVSKVSRPAIKSDAGLPFTEGPVPRDALNTTCVGNANAPIPHVLSMSGQSQVGTAVVQSVAINMINMKSVRFSHNETMKHNTTGLKIDPLGPKSIDRLGFWHGGPVPCIDGGYVHGVYDGKKSPRQRHVSHVAFDADLAYGSGHVATSLAAMGRSSASNTPGLSFMPRSEPFNKEYAKWR